MSGSSVTSALSLRDRIVRGAKVKSERLTLQLNDEAVEVEVRGLTAGGKGDLVTRSTVTRLDEEGEASDVQDLGKMYPQLIIASLYDPESGQPIFTDADLELVRGLDGATFDAVTKVATRLSGLSEDARKAIEGNSAATTGSASGSSSPES